jgi:PII-like signaling protein
MKRRQGFVTNSSSTNDIFTAVSTATVAGIAGVIINTVQPDEHTEVITYASLDTYHYPEDLSMPIVKVNDSEQTAWFYASVTVTVVQRTINPETGQQSVTVISEGVDPTYTNTIHFDYGEAKKWLTFAHSDQGILDGDEKVVGFIAESPYNDRPRKQRPKPPSRVDIKISVVCNDVELRTNKLCRLDDEAILLAYDSIVLNDPGVKTEAIVHLEHSAPYDWFLDIEKQSSQLSKFADVSLSDKEPYESGLEYLLVIEPNGTPIKDEKNVTGIIERVDFSGKSSAGHISDVWDYMTVRLLDEGLFHSGQLNDEGYLIVKSFDPEDLNVHRESTDIPFTPFQLKCVVKDEESEVNSAKFVELKNVEVNFDKIQGSTTATNNLAEAYQYDIEKDVNGGFKFIPKLELPQSDEPYKMTIPINCVIDEETYDYELPVLLVGEPIGYEQLWEEEYRKLRLIMRKYTPAETWSAQLKHIEAHKDRLSMASLRVMRHSIWITARDELLKEAAGYERVAEICAWTEWGLEGVKWLGDQAFSYLVKIYAGEFLEMFITPFKDVMLTLFAELSADILWNGKVMMSNEDIYRTSIGGIFAGFENLLDDKFGLSVGSLTLKDVGKYLASFAAVKCLNNYLTGKKSDGTPYGIYDAILDTCKDLTVGFFKKIVEDYLGNYFKSKKAGDLFEEYAGDWLKQFLKNKNAKIFSIEFNDLTDNIDVLVKYLTELSGVVAVKAYGKSQEIASTATFKLDNDFHITVNIGDSKQPILVTVSMLETMKDVGEFVFNAFTGAFPFPTSVVQVPANPQYIKKV